MVGPAAACAAAAGGRAGSRMNLHIRSAATMPGIPARKNACRQPKAVANATSSTGATNEPSRFEPKFCVTPIASPRCSGLTSDAIIAWLIGMMPPSAAPIRRRAPSSTAKEAARPERNEQAEKASVARISRPLRLPVRSDTTPMPKAATGPGERQRARQYPDLGVGKTQVGLHERHQEVERVAIEEDDAEIEAQERNQHDLVGRAVAARRRLRVIHAFPLEPKRLELLLGGYR